MKILQVITLSELGGAQSVVVNLANYFCEQHEVIVVAGQGDGKIWDLLDPRVVKCQARHLQRSISPIADLKALIELRKIYNEYKPDVIHLHSSKAGMLGRLAFPSKRIVYTVHGFDSIRVAHRKMLPVEKFMQNFCASIVAVSKYDYHNLLAEGIKANVSYIYNAIALPDRNTGELSAFFSKHKVNVLSIARVSYPKRHDIFIEVSRRLPQYGFIWIGNQEPIENLPSNCKFVGNISNAGAYCREADLLCLPSDFEGLPMVILEAMSCEKPIVASDVGGISEIVQNGKNGYVVNNNVESFVEKIDCILSDEFRKRDMGRSSKMIFESSLTIDKMADSYMNIYDSIVAKQR